MRSMARTRVNTDQSMKNCRKPAPFGKYTPITASAAYTCRGEHAQPPGRDELYSEQTSAAAQACKRKETKALSLYALSLMQTACSRACV